ncbi:MAG: CvpA family protein [Clostridia bacterium]|nr:CvpA family protein [Clostridia bacterium]
MSLNYIDIILIIIFALSVILGYKKGFLKTITGIISIVLSLVLAMTFYPHVSDYLKTTPIYDTIYKSTENVIGAQETENETEYETSDFNLPKKFIKEIEKGIDETTHKVKETVIQKVSDITIKIISVLIVFVCTRLLLLLISLIAGLIKKLPIIGWGDSMLGAIFGVVRALLITYILLAVVTFSASVSPDNKVAEAVKESKIAKLMYNDNAILNIIYK